jgi:integrase
MSYQKEQFILDVIAKYPKEFDPTVVNEYYTNKINLRTGKPITDGSKVNQLSVFKKFLRNIKDIPELEQLKLPEKLTVGVKTAQTKRTEESHRKQLVIQNATKFIIEILSGLNSKIFEKLYPALLLASGRRPTELYLMKFKKGKTDNEIIFSDQLKKRDGKKINFTIPLLVPVKLFRKALRNFQALHPEVKENKMTPDEIAKNFSTKNANSLLAFSEKIGFKLKSSDFRRIYAAESYRRSPDKTQSINSFIKDYLGHDSIDTSLNYSNVILMEPDKITTK